MDLRVIEFLKFEPVQFCPKMTKAGTAPKAATAHVLTENGQILAQDVDEIGKLAMGYSQFMQIQAINLNLKTVSAGKLPFPIISFRTHSRTHLQMQLEIIHGQYFSFTLV